jgi:hypothetical protein
MTLGIGDRIVLGVLGMAAATWIGWGLWNWAHQPDWCKERGGYYARSGGGKSGGVSCVLVNIRITP